MGLLPKRSWLGVFIALYMHLWRSHRKLVNAPQDLSYEDLTQPLLDGQQHRLEFERHGEARQINAHSTPPGWSGKTVVLIHDVKMRLQTWSPVWDLLREDGHRIIAVDLPGHGESNLTAGSLVLPSLTRDIQHIMDHFEVSQGVLVGHGVGGFLALQYFAEYRKRAAERLPFGFVCVACTAGNLKQTIGKERLRQMATAFAAVRLPDLMRLIWPCSSVEDLKQMCAWCEEINNTRDKYQVSPPPVLPQDAKDALKAVFDHFDKDGGGKISTNELVMSGLVDKDGAKDFIRKATDANGEIGLKDFCEMLCPHGYRATEQSVVGSTALGRVARLDKNTRTWRLKEAKPLAAVRYRYSSFGRASRLNLGIVPGQK